MQPNYIITLTHITGRKRSQNLTSHMVEGETQGHPSNWTINLKCQLGHQSLYILQKGWKAFLNLTS